MDVLSIVACLTVIIVTCKVIEHFLRKAYVENLTDKFVFITGCDTGFGNLLTKQLDTKGVHVIASCFTEEGSKQLNDETSDRVTTLLMDVTQHESVAKAYDEVKRIIPKESALWGVVNNAGIGYKAGSYHEWCRRKDYERTCAVNLFGAIDVTVTFLPLLKKSRGRLVQVSSVAGRLAILSGGYCESKFALEAFSDGIRRECKKLGYGVNVSVLEPGFFSTAITSQTRVVNDITDAWNGLSDEEKLDFPEEVLRKRITEMIKLTTTFSSPDLPQVVNSMEHALFARWPKTRYALGWDARLLWIPLSYLPNCIVDTISAHI